MPTWPTKEQIDASARTWIAEHWASGCPTCGSDQLAVGDDMVVSLPIRDGVLTPLDTFVGHPYVQIICRHCGLMAQLSSSVLGLTGTTLG